jgi:hypothetical protein
MKRITIRRGLRAAVTGLAGAALVTLLAVPSPQGAAPRFFHDDPLTREPETQDASAVKPWDIDLAVDLATNLFGRPGDKAADVRAGNVNTIDEVPDSSWFTNRIGARPVSIADAVRGPMSGPGPAGDTWTVTHAKETGFSPGFTIDDATGETWFVQFDPKGFPEAATGAVMVANKIFWSLGYYQVDSRLITVHANRLTISDTAKYRAPSGRRRPMRRADLDDVFRRAHRNADGTYRAVAGRAIPGKVLGGFRYHDTRPDDPNDVVPHEHRRELRALKVFGAWTNLVDMKAGNTVDTLITIDGRGVVRHYLQDVGSTFGSSAIGARDWDEGYDYLIQGRPLMKRALLFGLPLPMWARVPYPDEADIGRFEGKMFDPLRWKPRAPTAAFLRARPDDTFWAARRVAAFSDEMIQAIAKTGEFSNPRTAGALAATLIARRARILRAYLPAVNPIVDVALAADGTLTFANAAVEAGVAAAPASYVVEWARFDNATGQSTPIGERAVVTALRAAAPARLPAEAGSYVTVQIAATGGPRPWAVPVHAYFRRTAGSWTLVGLDRVP